MRLRALEPEDINLLLALENDETLWNTGNTHVPFSRYALTNYIVTCQNDLLIDRQIRLVTEHQGQTIGLADIFNYAPQHRRAEVGIALLPAYRGKGLAVRVMETLLDYCRLHLPISTLFAIVRDDNKPAGRLFPRCGFQLTATLPQWLRSPQGEAHNAQLYIISL